MRLACELNSGGRGCFPYGIGLASAANHCLVVNGVVSEISIDVNVACSEYAES